ncbi:adrenocorticotropic hormone receptor-like [Stylophora pistillata]|uniref:adrenocorticotropic hormone receptor-like n=1 Tax=Stylophora pistillata TaxID=50429 RepID=UPI000C04B9DB|nr:adrenocorticotropic hormone receptor-like [Stylophora pistillata]
MFSNMKENCSLNCSDVRDTASNNGLCRRYTAFVNEDIPRLFIILNSTVNIILMIVSILANSLVIAAVWKTPSLRYPSILFLCGLSLSDVFVGLIVEPFYVTVELLKIHGYPKGDNCRLETGFLVLSFVFCGVSFGNVTLTSMDRYLAIHYPLRYDTIVTIPRVYILIISCWVLSTFCSGLLLWNRVIFVFLVTVSCAVFLMMSTVIHVKIYRIVRHHRSVIQAQEQAIHSTNAELNMARFKKSAINTFLVYYFLMLCYLPFAVACSLLILTDEKTDSPILWRVATTTVYVNSALNPFLYCWRLPAMRGPVLSLFKKIFCTLKTSSS